MTQHSSPTLSTMIIPLLGSLFLTGIVAALLCEPPRHPTLSWPQLLAMAGCYVLIAAAVHAFALWSLGRVFHEHIHAPGKRLILGIWMSVAWLPLLALLIREHSIWMAALPPLISAHAAVFLKRTYRAGNQPTMPTGEGKAPTLFFIPEPPSLLRTVGPPAITAIALQAGLAALLLGHYLLAGLLFVLCPLLPIWLFPINTPRRRSPRSPLRSLLTDSLIVIAFTAIALIPFLKKGSFGAGLGALLEMKPVNAASSSSQSHATTRTRADGYTGIVLFAPAKPVQKTLPPPPVNRVSSSGPQGTPTIIPFDGPYWYFKQPDRRPRLSAPVVHADPTKANVHSTDARPLSMEAHQYLGTPIRMDCCTAIRVALRNADNRPGAIAVELLLKDASSSEPFTQSLGTMIIPSSAVHPMPLNRPPVDEVLNFSLPRVAGGRQFTEITVVIKPSRERAQAGAHIAIEHFVLVP